MDNLSIQLFFCNSLLLLSTISSHCFNDPYTRPNKQFYVINFNFYKHWKKLVLLKAPKRSKTKIIYIHFISSGSWHRNISKPINMLPMFNMNVFNIITFCWYGSSSFVIRKFCWIDNLKFVVSAKVRFKWNVWNAVYLDHFSMVFSWNTILVSDCDSWETL